MPTSSKFIGDSSLTGNKARGKRVRETTRRHHPYAEKSFKGDCMGLGFNVWCIHSKHCKCACSQAHPFVR
jgi:hypothetical protein